MADRVDLVVVGAGLMGAATAWSASRLGLSVLVADQFGSGHANGSSHGSARIVRRAYSDELYVRLTGRAFDLWDEVESASGARLLRILGALDFGPGRDVPQVTAMLTRCGVAHEVLDAGEAGARWPGMRFAGPVLFHPQAGTLDPAAAISAFLGLATSGGADVRSSVEVSALEPRTDQVLVRLADGERVTARTVVVAAGAWLEPLLGGQIALPPLRVTQQQVFHFPRRDPSAPPWPSVIHLDARGVYHLAGGRDGGPGDDRKLGEHDPGPDTTAATRDGVVDPAARQRAIDYVRRWLPGLDPMPRAESTCLYTSTPGEEFLLDRVGPIVICSPCSGHGAKFAPLIGELTTALVTGAADGVPERFRLAAHARARAGNASL